MDRGSADFGTLLKQYRLASSVTQERLAEQARISVAAVGSLERGIRRAPHRETVALLAEALGLSGPEKASFETAAEHARARQARADPTETAQGTLPTRLTTFVGRDNEIAEIEALLKLHHHDEVGPARIRPGGYLGCDPCRKRLRRLSAERHVSAIFPPGERRFAHRFDLSRIGEAPNRRAADD